MFAREKAWVDSAVYDFRDRLAAVVPDAWLPVEVLGARRPTFRDFGCGHYGCVMPTLTHNLVCKVTTDVLEARFIAATLKEKYFPDGIVRYKKIVALEGRTYRNRPVFVLWREEAFEVGMGWASPQDVFARRLRNFRDVAARAKDTIRRNPRVLETYAQHTDWAWRIVRERFTEWDAYGGEFTAYANIPKVLYYAKGPERVALSIETCKVIAEYMENEPEGYLVGGALSHYLDEGILLADVHGQNVGHTMRDDYEKLTPWVITDPGHAIFLDARHEPLSIPVV